MRFSRQVKFGAVVKTEFFIRIGDLQPHRGGEGMAAERPRHRAKLGLRRLVGPKRKCSEFVARLGMRFRWPQPHYFVLASVQL